MIDGECGEGGWKSEAADWVGSGLVFYNKNFSPIDNETIICLHFWHNLNMSTVVFEKKFTDLRITDIQREVTGEREAIMFDWIKM